ncbi:3,4-dehydroadipyl-CoA semialdehyde dehydrogenase [Sorangium sp. So ce131]|uniref:3,4-dehydroadipyl-CoA semialdehyde dehydrogenase n=1 Tax=Sorangium sp. So ce131 TaxID=3133282 RepID=UPI003F60B182
MERLESYVAGAWSAGRGKSHELVNPATEEPIAETSTEGIDLAAAVAFARAEGGPALRALTFEGRGALLRAMSRAAHAHRDALLEVAITNGGNTRGDAKFDVDGAIGTLAYYADLGAQLGDARLLVDGDGVQLGRSPRFFGQHILVPRPGVAVHINAFNFPAWGLAEKAACAILAGMPVITKPATSTALVAYRLMKIFTEHAPLPRGALSFVAGPPGDLLEHLGGDDVLAFTGSSATGAALRLLPGLARESVRINVEADSLNGAVLGPDAAPGSETYAMFLRDVARDMTQKAGQKCTAIRRIFAPAEVVAAVRDDLVERLREARVGDPAQDGVTVGPLTTADQLRGVRAGIERLAAGAAVAIGGSGPFEALGARDGKGYFVPPTLLVAEGPDGAPAAHEHEVFGPVATLFPYDGSAARAAELLCRGRGSLVCSVYSDDRAFAAEVLLGVAPYHGRVLLGSEKIADQAPGPGTVLPQTVHGGPGRAGGGEELGGLRGLHLYSQRTAVQGARPILEAILGARGGARADGPAAGGDAADRGRRG